VNGEHVHIVTWKYDVMEGKNHEDLLYAIRSSAPNYLEVPGLIRKYYGIAPDCRSVVEFYLWKSKTDADRFFNPDWDAEASRRWECALMTRNDFEAPMVVESEQKRLVTGV
jgi:hypothetical protein